MTRYVVVDASVAVKWVLREPHTAEALALAEQWAAAGIKPAAPSLFLVEVTNVLHRRTLAGDVSIGDARQMLAAILSVGVEIREGPGIHVRALELASELHRPDVYDTHYLALAEMLDADLWTADQRFFNALRGQNRRVRSLVDYWSETPGA